MPQTKADAIRQAHKATPKLGPTELAKKLTAKGVKVTPAHVSAVLGEARAKRKSKPQTRANGHGIATQVSAATALVKATGSVAEAKRLLEALSGFVK